MSEEKRKSLDNLVKNIAISIKRSHYLSQLSNKELAEKLISDVWGIMKLFGEKSDLLTEAIERLFVLDTPDRVYCTADGDYPKHGQMVQFEDEGIIYIGGYMADQDLWFTEDDECDNEPVKHPIYWRLLIGLEQQYERQKVTNEQIK